MAGADIDTGLIAHWRFDEGAGTIAADRKGTYTGTLISSPSWVAGNIGRALSFDGANARVNATINSNLSSSFTFSCWAKPSVDYAGLKALMVSEVASYSNYWIFLGTNTGLVFALYDGTNNPATATFTPSVDWHHVVGVRDTVADTIALYVDAVQKSSVNDTTTSTPTYSDFNIGKQVTVARAFTGNIDDVRIYNRALSGAEISKLYITYAGIAFAQPSNVLRPRVFAPGLAR